MDYVFDAHNVGPDATLISNDAREAMFGPNHPVGHMIASVPNQNPAAPFSIRLSTALTFFQARLHSFEAGPSQLSNPQNPNASPELRAFILYTIAVMAEIQYRASMDFEDLDLIISSPIRGLDLLPDNHPKRPLWLPLLVYSLGKRAQRSGSLDDINEGIRYGQQALSYIPQSKPVPDLMRDLSSLYWGRFQLLDRFDDLDMSITYGEKALSTASSDLPGLAELMGSMGASYLRKSHQRGTPEDLDKSGTVLERALVLCPDYPLRHLWLANLGTCYRSLFRAFGRAEDIEKAILCYREAVSRSSFLKDSFLPGMLGGLGITYGVLYFRTEDSKHLDSAMNYLVEAVDLTSDDQYVTSGLLYSLGQVYGFRYRDFQDLADFDQEKHYYEKAVRTAADDDLNRPKYIYSLGSWYYDQFMRTGNQQCVGESIKYVEQSMSLDPANSAEHRFSLGLVYRARNWQGDLELAIKYFEEAARDSSGTSVLRLSCARAWAAACPKGSDGKIEAYNYAITVLLPLTIWLGLSTDRRYESLVFDVKDLIAKAVAASIAAGKYDTAIEWFDQGHFIVWNQILQLRAPLDELYMAHPKLSSELAEVSLELDIASAKKSAPGPDGRLIERSSLQEARRHRSLAQKRDELLDMVRQIPGFEEFLLPPKAAKLRSNIPRGVVVIINLHKDQCDALIIPAGTENIIHVQLPSFTQDSADKARIQLWQSVQGQSVHRGFKTSRLTSSDSFRKVLKMLWFDVVKPVMQVIGGMSPSPREPLPHITWCSNGSLSFLPLHAAGDYGNIHSIQDYRKSTDILANIAVSSYAPTISALTRRNTSPTDISGILAIGHESAIRESNRSLDSLPSTKHELDAIERQVNGLRFTRLDNQEACIDKVLEYMHDHSWVHFACHGSQNSLSPMKSALHLHDKDLTLEMISRHPLKNAQLAFLSACQTATGNTVLPDEGLHLAAGLMMSGYPSVIATMWSIADEDAPLVTGQVYGSLLEGNPPDSRKAPEALRQAVAHLREAIGVDQFARWVPFIHIGG